jgi:hypothetical protein
MDAAVAGLIGAAIGALAGVIGSTLTAWQQNRAERERRQAARLDEFLKAERQALLNLAELVATGTQAMLWLAWAAVHKSSTEAQEEIDSYEARMRELLPRLLAAEAEAGSVSDDAFGRVNPLVDRLTVLDTEIGTAAAGFPENEDDARRQIAATKEKVLNLMSQTLTEIRTILRSLEPHASP